MSTKLIQTKDHILLLDLEAEIKEGDYILEKELIINIFPDYLTDLDECSKITAYYPLTKEAKELDLPLLPNPFRDYSIDRAKEFAIDRYQDIFEKHPRGGKLTIDTLRDVIEVSVETGYRFAIKESQSKQFSLEDMKKAIRLTIQFMRNKPSQFRDCEEEIIQSLSTQHTQQLPISFEPEYDKINDFGEPYTYDDMDFGVEIEYKLKTIINSEGKEELVGTYKF